MSNKTLTRILIGLTCFMLPWTFGFGVYGFVNLITGAKYWGLHLAAVIIQFSCFYWWLKQAKTLRDEAKV